MVLASTAPRARLVESILVFASVLVLSASDVAAQGVTFRGRQIQTGGQYQLAADVTPMNALIGTLRNEGGGRYRGDFSWPSNPQNVTVRSSLGGSASRAVMAK
jgi:hypothetical protein